MGKNLTPGFVIEKLKKITIKPDLMKFVTYLPLAGGKVEKQRAADRYMIDLI